VVVVSPFVRRQQKQTGAQEAANIISSLADVTFFQNQALTRGTSLLSRPVQGAGLAMVAHGSKPRAFGYTSHLQPPTLADKKLQTGKGFPKGGYTRHGRIYDRATSSRLHENENRKGYGSKSIKPRKTSSGIRRIGIATAGFGKALPYIGYGLVAFNIYGNYRDGRDPNYIAADAISTPMMDFEFGTPVLGSAKLGRMLTPNQAVVALKMFYPGGLF